MNIWKDITKRFTAWFRFLVHDFWRKEQAGLSRSRKLFYQQILLSFVVIRSFVRDKLLDSAGALVYTTLFAIVPFLAVLFSFMKGFGLQQHISTILTYALQPLGDHAVEVLVPQIMSFVVNTNIDTLGYIGFVLLFLSLLVIISTIESSFNEIWRVRQVRKMHRRIVEYIGFLFIGPIIGITVLGWTANARMHLSPYTTPAHTFLTQFLETVAPWLVTIIVFVYLVHFIPNTRVKVKSAFVGALVGATLWTLINWLFAGFLSTIYVQGTQAAIYARLAVLPLLLLWVFSGWTVLLFAAQIAYAHQHMDKIVWDEKHPFLSPLFYENLALKILLRTYYQYCQFGRTSTEEELSDYFRIPEVVIHTVAEELAAARYLVILEADELQYAPAKPPQQIVAADVMLKLRHFADSSTPRTDIDQITDKMAEKTDTAIEKSWHKTTLQDLLDDLPS